MARGVRGQGAGAAAGARERERAVGGREGVAPARSAASRHQATGAQTPPRRAAALGDLAGARAGDRAGDCSTRAAQIFGIDVRAARRAARAAEWKRRAYFTSSHGPIVPAVD
jgi:hypothetical protein